LVTKGRHPNKELEDVRSNFKENGWSEEISKGHPYSILKCPQPSCEHKYPGCPTRVMLPSTPTNPEGIARQKQRQLDNCLTLRGV